MTVSGNTVSGVMGIGVLQQYRADTCTCPAGSPNQACDAGFYFGSSVVQYASDTYHVGACGDADWAWSGGGVPWSTWQADGEDGAGSCGM